MARLLPSRAGEGPPLDLAARSCSVGRGDDNDLRLEVAGISRYHALVRRTEGGWEVLDQGSTNGSFVNGERVERAPLRHGDRVRFHETEFLFEDLPVGASAEAPSGAKADPPGLVPARDSGEHIPSAPPSIALPPGATPRPAEAEAGPSGTRALTPGEVAGVMAALLSSGRSTTRRIDPAEIAAAAALRVRRASTSGADARRSALGEAGPSGTRDVSPEAVAAARAAAAGSSGTRRLVPGNEIAKPPVGPTGTRKMTPADAGAAPAKPAEAAAAKPAAAKAGPSDSTLPGSPEAILGRHALLKEVPPALHKYLAEESEFRVYAPKAILCRQGEYTAEFFVLLSGLVGVFREDPDAGPRSVTYLATIGAGGWLGEMGCMSHAARSATCVAESDVVVLAVPRHAFMKVYGDAKAAKFKEMIDRVYRERALQNHLAATPLLRGLDRDVLARVGKAAELVVAAKGQVILEEGKPGDGLYLVRTGHAKLVRRSGGQEEILAWYCENSSFGKETLLGDAPREASVIAVDRMDLVRLPAVAFRKMAEESPQLREAIQERTQQLRGEGFASGAEAESVRRAREIGAGHEVIKAGDALVIDMSKCTRCNMCVEGCIEAHEDRTPRIGKRGIRYGDLLLTSSCYNCKVPDCMLACKFGAIRRDRSGQVTIDDDACTGCSLCEPACPYGTIHMQSLVEETGIRTLAAVGPVRRLLSHLPLLGSLVRAPGAASAAGGGTAVAPPPPGAKSAVAGARAPAEAGAKAPAEAGAKAGERKKLRLAVKCDLCAGRSDMACIASCPCGAIERVDPARLLGA